MEAATHTLAVGHLQIDCGCAARSVVPNRNRCKGSKIKLGMRYLRLTNFLDLFQSHNVLQNFIPLIIAANCI